MTIKSTLSTPGFRRELYLASRLHKLVSQAIREAKHRLATAQHCAAIGSSEFALAVSDSRSVMAKAIRAHRACRRCYAYMDEAARAKAEVLLLEVTEGLKP